MRKALGSWGGIALLVAALSGCGGPQFMEVEGTVKMDGKPLPNVVVQFLPDPEKATVGPLSAATSDDQGRVRLRAQDQREGAVVGWHRVLIGDPNEERPPQGQKPKKAARVPARYATAAGTPVRLEVKAGGPQVVDVVLAAKQ